MANKKYKLTDGNMWATDGIHDFGQNKTQRTINSEVNSALGGKAPTNHASTATTYGAASTSNYGHVKLSNTTPSMDGTAAVGDSTDVARANHVHPSDTSRVPTSRKVNNKQLSSDITLAASDVGAAPTDHASTATTYGKGTSSNYGHVKISDSLADTTTAATGGVVPSMKAVSDLNGAINADKYKDVTVVDTSGEDLDNYTTSGFYYFSDSPTNIPVGSNGYLLVFGASSTRIKQMWFRQGTIGTNDTNTYVRTGNGSVWSSWEKLMTGSEATANQLINLKWVRGLTNNEDLDGLYINGWYTTGYEHTYVNSPIPNDTSGQRIVVVMAYNNEVSTSYRHMFYANRSYGIYAHRCYASGRWSAWNTYGCTFLSESFTPVANTRPADYTTGEIVRIGSYNVANYNFNTSTYMNNGQMLEFRKFIAESKLDFLLTQEDRQYIGVDSSAPATNDYLYYPLLRQYNRDDKWNSIIRSHANNITTSGTHGRIVFSNVALDTASRSIEFCCFTVGSHTLLLCDTHCIWKDVDTDPESATSIAARKTNYEELFKWISGAITLRKYNDGTAVTVPTHTHAIVCMDANCITATDKTNLQNAASAYNFELANGGRYGWFKTCFDRNGSYALDEIAVSSNCIIVDVTARTDLYPKLYSDHVPVIAEVSLMPS